MYRSMMQVYVKNSVEALEFYQKAFDAKLLCSYFSEDKSIIEHSELDIHGQIFAVTELNQNENKNESEAVTGNTMQFCLHFGEGEESTVQKIYDVLKDGAKILYPLGKCEWSGLMVALIDKYGVNWCVFA